MFTASLGELREAALRQPGAVERSGIIKFQCPACCADGHDLQEDNAGLFPDGKWGCANTSTREHWDAIGRALGAFTGRRQPNSASGGSAMPGRAAEAAPSDGSYIIVGGRICRRRPTRDGEVLDPLCNFVAKVIEEIVLDDGAETTRAFILEGQLENNGRLPAVRVPVARFPRCHGSPNRGVCARWSVLGTRHAITCARRSRCCHQPRCPAMSSPIPAGGRSGMNGSTSPPMAPSAPRAMRWILGRNSPGMPLPLQAEDPVGAMRASLTCSVGISRP